MHALVPSAPTLLGLPTADSSNTAELTETIVSELLPDHQHDETSLQTLGCTATDETAETDFLLTTLLAHRILQSKVTPPHHEERDRGLADALSRLTLLLGKPAVISDISHLCSYITSLLPSLPKASTPLTKSLNAEQRKTLQTIQTRLHGEHRTRVELLLTRFSVTVSAFSRSRHARDEFFYDRSAERMRRNAEAVSLYQAIAAGEGVLKEPRRKAGTETIKSFIMGDVPDRGGRLDKPFMPSFKSRMPTSTELMGGKRKGKKSKKGKRRQFDAL